MNYPLYLSAAGDASVTPAPPPKDWPTSEKVKVGDAVKEIPITYLDKDAIEVGAYVHPVTGQQFEVTPDRIDHWVDQVNSMTAVGIEIPAPVDHSKTERARERRGFVSGTDNLGFVVGAKKVVVDGKPRLRLTHQLYGDDAVVTALRNRSSIFADDFQDKNGRVWKDAIVHNAFTPIPVVSGMGSFKAFAASRAATDTPIFSPAREIYGDSPMLKPEQKDKIKALLKAAGKSDADVGAMDDGALLDAGVAQMSTAGTQLARLTQENTALTTERDGLKATNLQLSREKPPTVDPEVARLRMELASSKVDGLVTAGKVTPQQVEYLQKQVKDNGPLMLSRGAGEVSTIEHFIEFAKLGGPVPKPGERSGDQSLLLSRETPGNTPAEDADMKALQEKDKAWAKTLDRQS